MNQITYDVGKKRKRNQNTGKFDTRKTIKIFAVAIIVFGLILVSQGTYAMVSRGGKEPTSTSTAPKLQLEQVGANIEIRVSHDKPVAKITYSWNYGAETVLNGKRRQEITELIEIPEGSNNLLAIEVQDNIGMIVKQTASFTSTSSDVEKPVIKLSKDGDRIVILVTDNLALDRVEYHWNNEDPTTIRASAKQEKKIEEKIEVLKGQNTLVVEAYDKVGNKQIYSTTVKTANNPKITMTQMEGTKGTYIIKVSASANISEVTVEEGENISSTNGAGEEKPDLGEKTLEFEYPLNEGEHKIKITARDVNGLEDVLERTILVSF